MAGGYSNGKIYLVGGYSSANPDPVFAQVWEYDVAANTWATKTSMPKEVSGTASAVVNGHLYVIGGRDPVNTARNQTYDYNIALDSWSVRASTPYPVNVPGTAVVSGKIWVIGGGTPFLGMDAFEPAAGINSPNVMGTVMIYSPNSDSWTNGLSLNIPRSFIAATAFRNRIIAAGGWEGSKSSGAIEVIRICGPYLPLLRR
jgi:N-acetylneuraminic acid mutarotase